MATVTLAHLKELPFTELKDEEIQDLYTEKTEWLFYTPFDEEIDPYEDYGLEKDYDMDDEWRHYRPHLQWWEQPDPYF